MYIYKMTDSSGTFIGTSESYPDQTDPRFSKQYLKMDDPEVTIIRDDVGRDEAQVQAFNEAVNEVLTSDRYDLLNGRFQSIDPVMKYLGRHFILIVVCESNRMVYITKTYNPVDKLYRVFVSHRGRKELVRDVVRMGREGFTVDIVSTFDNPYREMLRLFDSYVERGYGVYNAGTYESLRSASETVDGIEECSPLKESSG